MKIYFFCFIKTYEIVYFHSQRLRLSTLETVQRSCSFTRNCKEICLLIKTLNIYLNSYQLSTTTLILPLYWAILRFETIFNRITEYLIRFQICHTISNFSSKLQKLLWCKRTFRFNVRVVEILVIKSSTPLQKSEQITVWNILEHYHDRICRISKY